MRHINIAICDDDNILCSRLESIISKILETMSVSYNIDVYYDGSHLYNHLETATKKPYNLIFLDIEMPEQSGIDTGNQLRTALNDQTTQLVYISSKESYAMNLFKIRPMDFLIKPVSEEQLREVINCYIALTGDTSPNFNYKKANDVYSIPMKDILYFENKLRQIIIHSSSKSDTFYGSIEELYTELEQYNFLHIHKSYLINYSHIQTLSYEYVIMTDNTKLPISRSKRLEIRDKCAHLRRNMVT